MMELGVDEISLAPSSYPPLPPPMRLFDIRLGCGSEPGPDGDGKWRDDDPVPMPGDGARRGGVARPKPESESVFKNYSQQKKNKSQSTKNIENIKHMQKNINIQHILIAKVSIICLWEWTGLY